VTKQPSFLPERRRERWEGGSWRAKHRDSASGLKKLDLVNFDPSYFFMRESLTVNCN